MALGSRQVRVGASHRDCLEERGGQLCGSWLPGAGKVREDRTSRQDYPVEAALASALESAVGPALASGPESNGWGPSAELAPVVVVGVMVVMVVVMVVVVVTKVVVAQRGLIPFLLPQP
jgi:hypothetical protein